jgi:HicB family
MQVQPVINAVQAALASQGSLAGGDVAVEEALDHLVTALAPAIRQAAMDLAEQAACEVRAQLPDRTVDLVLSDGDPSLRIAEPAVATDSSSSEELDARITLRVPPSLKSLIEDAAETAGASVNSWVLDALSRRTRKPQQGQGFRLTHSFDL